MLTKDTLLIMRLLFKITERLLGKPAKKYRTQTLQIVPLAIAELELSEELVSALNLRRRN